MERRRKFGWRISYLFLKPFFFFFFYLEQNRTDFLTTSSQVREEWILANINSKNAESKVEDRSDRVSNFSIKFWKTEKSFHHVEFSIWREDEIQVSIFNYVFYYFFHSTWTVLVLDTLHSFHLSIFFKNILSCFHEQHRWCGNICIHNIWPRIWSLLNGMDMCTFV